MSILNKLLLWWYKGKYTKIKLIKKETIGVDDGYFECQIEHNKIFLQYYDDIKTMNNKEAGALFNERHDKMLRKYFGPRYVKA